MPITHRKIVAIPDGLDATLVRPSDWNETHNVVIDLASEVTGTLGSGHLPMADIQAAVVTTYTHNQLSAAAVWTIAHGLGRIPQITIIDSGGDEVEGASAYPDLNTVILSFSAAFGGTAYLS